MYGIGPGGHHGHPELREETVHRRPAVDRGGRRRPRLAVPDRRPGDPAGRAARRARDAGGAVRGSGPRGRRLRSRHATRSRPRTCPLLTDLRHWDKLFESPFKSDVYFFSTRLRLNQTWGTANPLTIRDREFGAVRVRAFGVYSYPDRRTPRSFFQNISGTRETLRGRPSSRASSAARWSRRSPLTSARARCPSSTWRPIRTRSGARCARRRGRASPPSAWALEDVPDPERVAARGAAEASRRAHRHGHRRRSGALHAVPGGAVHSHRGGGAGRGGGRRRRPGRGHRHGPGHVPGHPAGAGGAGAGPARGVALRDGDGPGRRRHHTGRARHGGQRLPALPDATRQAQQVLPRVRGAAGVDPPRRPPATA